MCAGYLDATGIKDFYAIQQETGPATWLSELIWREFYKHIVLFPPSLSL